MHHKVTKFILGYLAMISLFSVPTYAETEKIFLYSWWAKPFLEIILNPTIEDYGPYELVESEKLTEGRRTHEE